MDLNASPLPEEDEQSYAENIESALTQDDHIESAVATMRREREERRRKMRRDNEERGAKRHAQTASYDYKPQTHSYRKKEVPQGWLDCPPVGECIDKLIPSKVPLDDSYNDAVNPGNRYSSRQLINKQKKKGREIGLVLDLTNTTRYYSTQEWTKLGIKHLKIPCKGRDSVPDNESVNRFVFEVMQFLDRQKSSRNPNKYIVVHCTHGHNRTGFMIVHFLMRSQVFSVTQALNIFAERRPPGIYKPDYIQALYDFYHEVPDNMVCPPTPEWKRSSDLDLNGEAVPDDDDDDAGDPSVSSNDQLDNKNITNDDVLGDAIPYDQQEALRFLCYRLLELPPPPQARGTLQFPGSHPVSLNSDNLQLLRQRYYYTTWKADGTRYMMLILRDGCYLVDRTFSFRRVQMRFPLKNIHDGFHDLTLIDGEMIIDKIPEVGLKRRYLAYDLMALNGVPKVKLPFSERWKLIEEEIIRPRNYERKQFEVEGRSNPVYRYDMELFGVRRKDFWLLSTVTKLLKEFIPRLSHEADGLIFQGWDDPYVCRTHEGLLKWKYPEMNSVDFLFEIGSENRHLLFLYERGKKKLMDGARINFGDVEDLNAISGKIVECSWNSDEDCWVCMRIRTDKATPNDINTYRKVLRSIKDNITEEVLLGDISEIVRLPMYADRIAHLHHRRR
ncbi:mRNA-capping enzyme [Rhynchospora pubera]|uniref:mRNA guanylyltransferase n=1 Tax=Rhynchospora pubera TaxID=906938 RepID=A0AAV8EEG5_9POAL|nr:mRNA-capping enzyme [Rhynchospora pubera]